MKNNIVHIENVSVSYREDIALRNINLKIEENDFLSLVGPNGAGKTTLLTVINGLGKIISGRVRVFNREMVPSNLKAIRRDVGYVSQNLNIDPRAPISVREVVSMGRFGKKGLFKRLNKEDDNIIRRSMETVGISSFAKRPIGHLSGGQQQKVAVASALAQEPKILLLDEPTSSLDLKAAREIIDLIEKIYSKMKITVIYVTHILNHIPGSCQRALFVKNGSIIMDGKKDKIIDEKNLSGLYGCDLSVVKDGALFFAEPKS